MLKVKLSRFDRQRLRRSDSCFLNLCFVCLRMTFFVAFFSVLDNFKILVSSLFYFIFFSYFSFFISFICDGLRDGKITCFQKRLDGLHDCSLSCMFLLLGLELAFVKLYIVYYQFEQLLSQKKILMEVVHIHQILKIHYNLKSSLKMCCIYIHIHIYVNIYMRNYIYNIYIHIIFIL